MAPFALYGGIAAIAVLLLAAWWRARSATDGLVSVTNAIWAGLGTVVAVGINQPVGHLVGRTRPYYVLPHAEVLVAKAHDFTFPSDHATAAGAAVAGLWLVRDRPIALAASFVGLLLGFARVYVGAHYPGDVVGGFILGPVVVLALRPLALRILGPIIATIAKGPLRPLALSGTNSTGAVGAET